MPPIQALLSIWRFFAWLTITFGGWPGGVPQVGVLADLCLYRANSTGLWVHRPVAPYAADDFGGGCAILRIIRFSTAVAMWRFGGSGRTTTAFLRTRAAGLACGSTVCVLASQSQLHMQTLAFGSLASETAPHGPQGQRRTVALRRLAGLFHATASEQLQHPQSGHGPIQLRRGAIGRSAEQYVMSQSLLESPPHHFDAQCRR